MAARKRRAQDGSSKRPSSTAVEATEKKIRPSTKEKDTIKMSSFIRRQPVWILLAVASGACAAINGVFAKLTTTSLTSSLATYISTLFGLQPDNNAVNLALRGTFFGLNLLFNGIMWALFTAALTKGSSTTRVSIVNVSANFFVTAMLGWAIFGEKLPIGWWMGAGLLAAGNVVIGRREEGEKKPGATEVDLEGEQSASLISGHSEDTLIELDDPANGNDRSGIDDEVRIKRAEEVDAPV